MPQQGSQQSAASGDVSYRVNKAGEIRKATGKQKASAAKRIDLDGRYISVEILIDGDVNIRVGAKALIDGNRVINREFRVTDPVTVNAVEKTLVEILDDMGDLAEEQVMHDAQLTVIEEDKDESEIDDEEDDA